MKTLYIIGMAVILFGFTTGCTSTVTLGKKANDEAWAGASAGAEGASVTLPFVKGEVTPHKSTKKK